VPDWQKVKDIYHDALNLPENERVAFLAQACAGEAELRHEVESLLNARAERAGFLGESIENPETVVTDASPTPADRARQSVPTQVQDLLRECVACGECGDGETRTCPRCGGPLATLLPVERTVAGRYRIERRIGQGGMGTVYLATHLSLRRPVALKVLGAAFFGDETALRRFEREARSAARLQHPNVVKVYDYGKTTTGGAWLALEYVEGVTLREEIQRSGRPPLSAVCDWFEQIAAGIRAAHDAGIVHRDLKPENVMIVDAADGQRHVRILDFGLAQMRPTDDAPWSEVRSLTAPGTIIGTPMYMAPEQFAGEADERTDIFALGAMLAEMLTGRPAFERENYQDTRVAITREPYHLLGNDAAVRRLDAALQKCMAKAPDKRYAGVKALQDELLPLLRACPSEFAASLSKQADGPVRRRAILLIAAIAVLALFAGWYAWHRPTDLSPMKTELVGDWKREGGYSYRLSPDEQKVAFVKAENGQIDIYVKPLKGGEAIRLTNDAWADAQPLWSPDGQQLIYFSTRNNKQEVWRIPSQGGAGELVKVLNEPFREFVRWSQDGRRIFYVTACDLYALDLQTHETNRLTSFEQDKCRIHDIAVSRDERWIAYPDNAGGARHIWAKLIDGGTPIRVTQADDYNDTPLWAPDGKRIIYSCKRNGIEQICAGYLDGRAPTQLTFGQENLAPLHVTADGQRILYRKESSIANLFRLDLRAGKDVCLSAAPTVEFNPTISADGRTVVYQQTNDNSLLDYSIWARDDSPNAQALRLTEHAFDPRWSPQGRKLAFLRNQGDSTSLWTINSDGTQERAIVTDNVLYGGLMDQPFHWNYPSNYSWSPDGNRLAYVCNPTNVANLWTVGSDGEGAQNLTNNVDPAASYVNPLWSPDGRRIAYLTYRNSPQHQWRIAIAEAGQVRTLYQAEQRLRLLGWARGNAELIFANPQNNASNLITEVRLARLNIKTGKATPAATFSATYFVSTLLAPDGKRVAFTKRENDRDELWVISLADGQTRKLRVSGDPAVYFAGLAWSPDSHSLYFSKQSNAIAFWAIDNFK